MKLFNLTVAAYERIQAEYRTWVRAQAGTVSTQAPIVIEEDARPPTILGEPYYHTTPSGKTRVNHPNAYGYRTLYHPSTLAVHVGRKWLAARGIDAETNLGVGNEL